MPFKKPVKSDYLGCAGRDYRGATETSLSGPLYYIALQEVLSHSFQAFSCLPATFVAGRCSSVLGRLQR